MNIHIAISAIREIVSIAGYVFISAVFGVGFFWSDNWEERTTCLFSGIVVIVAWRFFVRWIL
jgi:hypothetical protein